MFIPTAPKHIRRAVRRGFISGYIGQPANRANWWHYMGWLNGSRLSKALTPCGARRYILATS